MVQIIHNKRGFGSQLGEVLGESLGQGLQQFAHHKLQNLHKRERARELEKIGVDPEEAQWLSGVSEKERSQFLTPAYFDYLYNKRSQKQNNQQPPQQFAPASQQQVPSDLNQANRPGIEDILRSLSGGQKQQQNPFAGMSQQMPQQQYSPNQQFGQAAAQQQISRQTNPQQQFGGPHTGYKGYPSNTAQEANDIKREKYEFDKQQKLEKFEEEKQNQIDKKYSKLTERFEKDYEVGSQVEVLADELLALNEEIGNGWGPLKEGVTQGIKKISYGFINAPALVGTEGQVFRTKTNEAVTLLSNALKGLPSKFRVAILEASKPSLDQSYEARKQNILDLKKKGKVFQIPFEEQQKIFEENGGRLPADFSQRALPSIEKRQREILTGNSDNNENQDLEFDTLEEAQAFAKKHGAKAILNTETNKKFKV